MSQQRLSYILLHLIVFIWSWTAILGKAISVEAFQLVWLRMMIASVGILVFFAFRRKAPMMDLKSTLKVLATGLMVATHWICFYASIKASNVSITLACFACTSLFSSMIEPIILKRKVRPYEIVLGCITLIALSLIFQVEANYKVGIILGILSSFTAAFFGSINGLLVKQGIDTNKISLYELIGGFIGISVYTFFTGELSMNWLLLSDADWTYLLILGIICTSIPFLIATHILKQLTPFTLAITLNLETIYGIILAFFIYNEHHQLTNTFFIATGIILSTIFANALIKNYHRRKLSLNG